MEHWISTDPSPLDEVASALLRQAVAAIANSRTQTLRAQALLNESHEILVWTDHSVGESRQLREQLRNAVAAIAGRERKKGAPPEKVVTLLKGLTLNASADQLESCDTRSLIEDVVRWGIEAYYAA